MSIAHLSLTLCSNADRRRRTHRHLARGRCAKHVDVRYADGLAAQAQDTTCRASSCQRCKSRKQSRGISDAPLAHCVPRVTHGRGNNHVAAPEASCGCNAVNYSASTLRTVSLHAPQRVVRCSQSTMSPPDWLKAGSMLGPTHYACGVSSYTSVEARDSEAKCAHHSHFGDIVVEDLDAAAEARHEPQAS